MSDNILQFKIATPEKVVYEDEIKQASIPTTSGEVTILPNHIPLVSVLQAGEIKITDKDGEHDLAVAGGFLEVRDNGTGFNLQSALEKRNGNFGITTMQERAEEIGANIDICAQPGEGTSIIVKFELEGERN